MLRSLSPQVCLAAGATSTLAAALAGLLLLRERRLRERLEKEAQTLRDSAARSTRLREEERRGRIRAEQRLRAPAALASTVSEKEACDGQVLGEGDTVGEHDLALPGADDGFIFRPIGFFASCYRSRCGTPRQGGVVSESLAVLRCVRDLNPNAALEGFAAYSHCWVVYVFHENTNLPREGRTVANRRGQRRGRVPLWQGLCMKVAPPRCPDKDLRVGVLACRTPHRPNPLGLSLARVVHVNSKAGEVILAGLDVVDGTPCLDIKPYLPQYECIPTATVPDWVQSSFEEPLMRVEWSPQAMAAFKRLLTRGGTDNDEADIPEDSALDSARRCIKPWPFESREALRKALEGTLELDIRSPVQRQRHPNPGPGTEHVGKPFFVGDLWFHELHITYALLPADASSVREAPAFVRIEGVEPRPAVESAAAVSSSHEAV